MQIIFVWNLYKKFTGIKSIRCLPYYIIESSARGSKATTTMSTDGKSSIRIHTVLSTAAILYPQLNLRFTTSSLSSLRLFTSEISCQRFIILFFKPHKRARLCIYKKKRNNNVLLDDEKHRNFTVMTITRYSRKSYLYIYLQSIKASYIDSSHSMPSG